MWRKVLLFVFGSIVFLFFTLFSYLVSKEIFNQLDFDTTVRFQDNISRRFDSFFSLFSFIGSVEIVSIVLVFLILLRRKFLGFFAIFFYGILHVLELFGKLFVDHFPPPEFLLRTERFINFPQFHVRAENSYPSGHSARALFLTTLLFFILLRNKKIPKEIKLILIGALIVYDIVMLVSRIYLGEHWTSDVVGGSLLGLSLAIIAAIFI